MVISLFDNLNLNTFGVNVDTLTSHDIVKAAVHDKTPQFVILLLNI